MTQTLRTEASSRGAEAAASASQARWAAPGGSLPLRARLALLMLAVLTPALLLTAALLWDMDRQAIGAQERQLAATARTLALVVDARIAEQVAVLEALAVSPQLAQADWAGFSDQAKRALSGSEAWVAVGDAGDAAERRVYMNTLRRRSGPIPAVVKAAPTWSGKRGGALVSDGLWGPASGEFLTLVKKTVRLKDGRVVELVVAEPAASFSALLQRQGLPSGWTASVLDSRHQVVARNHGAERLTGHKVESAPLASAPRGV